MRAEFLIDNSTIVSYSNIIGLDISMYDEIMISSMSSDEFKIQFAYNPLANDPIGDDLFSMWWKEVSSANLSIKVKLIDSNGIVIANGEMFEWNENKEDFSLEITFKSILGIELAEEVNIDEHKFSRAFFKSRDVQYFASRWEQWLSDLWIKAGIRIPYVLKAPDTVFFSPLCYPFINQYDKMSSSKHYFYIKQTYYGDKKGLLKKISQVLNAKIVYNASTNTFDIFPFRSYSDNPINITGYIKSSGRDIKEQALVSNDLFNEIQIRDQRGHKFKGLLNQCLSAIVNRLLTIVRFKKYKIWGFAGKIINTGETIRLDSNNYYVKDISYVTERLDDTKEFECEAVIFDNY